MNYSTGCAFSTNDLFLNFPYEKLEFNCNDCERVIGDKHRDTLVKRIFRDSVYMILNDIIENSDSFQLPLLGAVKADIHMLQIRGDNFAKLKRSGKWKDLDFLETNFTGYLLGLYMQGNRTPRVKNIYVNPELRDKIVKNANNGLSYC